MDFYAVLDQAVDLLRQRGRVTYRALKLQFQLDDDQLEALKDELLYAHPQVVDDAGRGWLWTRAPEAAPPSAVAPAPAQDRTPLSYTPPHLAEQVERLAHHVVRGEVWNKAVTYCRQAGTRAMARSAHHEAVGRFEQALAALEQLPEDRDRLEQAIDLRLELRNALLPLGEHARILDHLHAAETLAERLNDPQRLGWIACYLCNSLSVIDKPGHDQWRVRRPGCRPDGPRN
jgi:hypothetical protein